MQDSDTKVDELIRPLDQLPPLEFPISQANWKIFRPTVAEYSFMVDEYHRRKGIDPVQAVNFLDLSDHDEASEEWDFEKYEYSSIME